MRSNLILLALLFPLASQAVTLDYRHEFTDVDDADKSRLLITHRFANGFGFGLESKWKSEDTFQKIVSNGNEVTLSYQFSATDRLKLMPVFVTDSGSSYTGYKPGIYGSYRVTDNLSFAARYRWEHIEYTAPDEIDDQVNRADLWAFYKVDKWFFEYNYFYIHSKNRLRYDNKNWDYEHSVKVQYNINESWGPYVTVLNKVVSKDSDDRQTGFRVGLQYRF